MNTLRAEARKILTLRAVMATALLGSIAPILLAGYNAAGIHTAHVQGRADTVTPDLGSVGLQEIMLAVAAAAAIGALSMGSEYRTMPATRGGGCQATTTGLAVPHRGRAMAAKAAVTGTLLTAMALVAACGSLLAAHHYLHNQAPALDPGRWLLGLRCGLYVVLTGLLSLAIAALLRNGLLPLIYLVANSTIICPGYLLTHLTRWAWYLPDTSGMSLVPGITATTHPPTAAIGAAVMTLWALLLLLAATVAQTRRDV